MKRSLYLLSILLMIGVISGCASMSKKDCQSADWHAIGHGDGARGIHYNNLAKHRQSCGKHEIVPDEAAYHAGWEQGIRNYCTSAQGYKAGTAGQAYRSICPQDVEENFRYGWKQGVRQYCTAENGLRQGLAGRKYRGVCPADLEPAFYDYYRLGSDVRKARAEQKAGSKKLERMESALAAEKDPQKAHKLLSEVERLQHLEDRGYTRLIGLEACMDDDWFETGYLDGEAGYPRRASEIAMGCRNYGITGDRMGYREGWQQGNSHYCTYESGLYIGQSNQTYSGVCSGRNHHQFWQGYEEGRERYRSERRARHPRPEKKHVIQQSPLRSAPVYEQKEHHQPAASQSKNNQGHDDRRIEQPESVKREAADKAVHDNRDREMRQPHSQAAEPAEKHEKMLEKPHDNRDKLKHPMSAKSQKPESKVKQEHQEDDEEQEKNHRK